jgi:hypothetical protein
VASWRSGRPAGGPSGRTGLAGRGDAIVAGADCPSGAAGAGAPGADAEGAGPGRVGLGRAGAARGRAGATVSSGDGSCGATSSGEVRAARDDPAGRSGGIETAADTGPARSGAA